MEDKDCKMLDLTKLEEGDEILIGRNEDCDLVINDPEVSSKHAKVIFREGGAFIRDLESRKGVLLNGSILSGLQRLRNGDLIKIAEHQLKAELPQAYSDPGARLVVEKVFLERKNKKILKDISFSVEPGEFVGIVGPSGCGKSTLMGVIAGTLEASSGNVLINGLKYSSDELKEKTGFLPQFVVTHPALTINEILNYARKIFTGTSLSPSEAIAQAGLQGKEEQKIKTLSGGQQKRAGLVHELLYQPDLLCLDEVTSGLDPSSEKEMMILFKSLSKAGKTVLCITHYPERLALCDKLIVLMDGFMIFYGSPQEALKYFKILSLEDLYDKMREKEAKNWKAEFKCDNIKAEQKEKSSTRHLSFTHPLKQFFPLLARYFKTWLKAPTETLFLFLQGIAIGLLVGLCFGTLESGMSLSDEALRSKQILFSLILASIWIGATTAVREIVKERQIIAHEGRRKLSAIACVMSRFCALTFFSGVGVFLLCAIVLPWTKLSANAPFLFLSLLVASAASVALGLLVSAICSTQEKALTVLPVLIIALALFSGGIQKLKGPSLYAGKLCYSYWAFDMSKHSLSENILEAKIPSPPVLTPEKIPQKTGGSPIIEKPEKYSLAFAANLFYGALFLSLAALGVRRTIKKG